MNKGRFPKLLDDREQAAALFSDVRDILNERHDFDFPQPKLVACPERLDFMEVVPPHSPIQFTEAAAPISQFFTLPHTYGQTDERCAILFNDPKKCNIDTRRTALYAQGFAHELGHCVLCMNEDIGKMPASGIFDDYTAADVLQEGVATYIERDFLISLTNIQRRHFRMALSSNKLSQLAKAVSFGANWLLSSRSRFYNRSFRTISDLLDQKQKSVSDLLRNPMEYYQQLQSS